MKEKNLSLLVSLLFLAGCSIPNQSRYEVGPPGQLGGSHATAAAPADKEAVKEILQTAASQLRLKDMTASSLAPNALVYYQQIDSNHPVKLIAWMEGEKIFIEMMHWPETIGETLPYRGAREYIESELKRRFGDRSTAVAFKNLTAKTARPRPNTPATPLPN